jgi:hypothetical protein
MARNKPDLKIVLNFKTGKCFKIDLYLYLIAGGFLGKYFKIKFTDCDGSQRTNNNGGTISKLVDRIRKLIVAELAL